MHATLLRSAIRTVVPPPKASPLSRFLRESAAQSVPDADDSTKMTSEPLTSLLPKGSSTESHTLLSSVPVGVFEGLNRHVWVDSKRSFCHLCQETVGNVTIHSSDRDHTSMLFFLLLYTAYPRHDLLTEAARAPTAGERAAVVVKDGTCASQSSPPAEHSRAVGVPRPMSASRNKVGPLFTPKHVLSGAKRHFPSLFRYVTDCRTTDRLHVVDDAVRRAELEALLLYLAHPPHQALSHVLQGQSPNGFWYNGERMWKAHISRIVAQLYPPMSAGMMTNFTQKCWGRTNGERLYDALCLHRIKAYHGWGPFESKERKAFFLRHLIWELLCVEVRDEVSEEAKLLTSLALRRLAFEMVFLQSMDYMDRVQRVHELLGSPSLEELKSLNAL
ncbi:hypothetical protein, conserved [Leishmania donovani]|uniref:Uncharacterized protein n=1 Tax=Leishmania donovani TaxID=5661 RepID=E9BCN8_LEIDO|nr:hypothetical protein, conserved [Leishmania donovani]TPP51207.1 hypothetical protein CGC21_25195 [Leishmania donovani]CBZ33014.1 hypothetical protein, conserved [Leishmania donovani]